MARKLTKTEQREEKVRLNTREICFRIAIETPLVNGYEFKDLSPEQLKSFHRFISDTVYKQLTISQVDKLYLRKQGLGSAPPVLYNDRELIHYGKDRNPFRLFGYYNTDGYFVICRIDGEHKTNEE